MTSTVLLSILLAAFSAVAVSAQYTGKAQLWMADSYAVNGKCYCDGSITHTTGQKHLDAGIGEEMVTKPDGSGQLISVKDLCALIGEGPEFGRQFYNDVQCGNGPAHPQLINPNTGAQNIHE